MSVCVCMASMKQDIKAVILRPRRPTFSSLSFASPSVHPLSLSVHTPFNTIVYHHIADNKNDHFLC